MHNEERIIELLTEQLKRQDQMVVEMREIRGDIRSLQTEQAKTNLAIGELRLSVMRLAEAVERLNGLEHRVDAIEQQLRRAS